jgi:hypothetical protein
VRCRESGRAQAGTCGTEQELIAAPPLTGRRIVGPLTLEARHMATLLFKVLVTAILVIAISELGKRSTLAGALLASLPLMSLLALVWLYRDTGDALRAAQMASGIFWLVLPSLLFFLVFPFGVKAGWGFWPAMGAGIVASISGYASLLAIDRGLDLKLFG